MMVEFFFSRWLKKREPPPNHVPPSKNSRQGHAKLSPRPPPTLIAARPKVYRSIDLDTVKHIGQMESNIS